MTQQNGLFQLLILVLAVTPAAAWLPVPHAAGTAHRLDGYKASGAAETGNSVYLLIEPEQVLPAFSPDERNSYRNIIFNYGDSYICGPAREVKITVDGTLLRETEPSDGKQYDWHIFRKGFLTSHYGEVLNYESPAAADGSDLAARMLTAKHRITLERKLDNCGDDGVFVFELD